MLQSSDKRLQDTLQVYSLKSVISLGSTSGIFMNFPVTKLSSLYFRFFPDSQVSNLQSKFLITHFRERTEAWSFESSSHG